jgi:ferrochelatase
MMNMGGPSTVAETYDFLLRLFSDGDLIPMGRFQPQVAKFIARRRTADIEKKYEEIGGGSPIKKWTEYQASEACKLLDRLSPHTAPHKPYIAFRYANPLTEVMYQQLLDDGVKRAVAFTQYPQYSYSTTRSSVNELRRVQKQLDANGAIQWSIIERWPTHPGLVRTFARHIQDQLNTFDRQVRDQVIILFSAHSIPMSVVNQGDPYPAEVAATVFAVMQQLKFSNPYRLVWQSQVGPRAWLGAQTDKVVKALEKRDTTKGIVIVPIAFTSDHIETLHEIDIELKEEMKRPEILRRAESLNGDPEFIQAIADVANDHLNGNLDNQIESGAGIKSYIMRI